MANTCKRIIGAEVHLKDGCPYDCGLCPEHKQHACLVLIEVNTACNLACPTCFANAGPGYNITMEECERMLDTFVRTEGEAEVVQFSGGEPTLHPQLFDMIRMAREKGVKHVMVNTNGLRIVRGPEWATRFAEFRPTIYFQFDGLDDATYVRLRGEPLSLRAGHRPGQHTGRPKWSGTASGRIGAGRLRGPVPWRGTD